VRHILSGAVGGWTEGGRIRQSSSAITGELVNTLRLIEKRHGAEAMALGTEGEQCNPHWSLLKLNPQKQRGYMELLQEHYPSIESYFPVYRRVCRPAGVRKAREVVRPVYPGYVFLRVVDQDLRGPVSMPVSAKWVRFGGRIEAIPGFVINRLRTLESANELVREVRYVNPYVPGVRVRVHLPVQDIMGVVVKLVRHNRALVDTPLGRATVQVHALQIV
jgi:hypothetical protein